MNRLKNPASLRRANSTAISLSNVTNFSAASVLPQASMMVSNAGSISVRRIDTNLASDVGSANLFSPRNRSPNNFAVSDMTGFKLSKNAFRPPPSWAAIFVVVAHEVVISVNRFINQSVVSPAALNVLLMIDPRFLKISTNWLNRV